MSDIDYREEKIGSPAEDGEACEDFDSLAKDCVVLNFDAFNSVFSSELSVVPKTRGEGEITASGQVRKHDSRDKGAPRKLLGRKEVLGGVELTKPADQYTWRDIEALTTAFDLPKRLLDVYDEIPEAMESVTKWIAQGQTHLKIRTRLKSEYKLSDREADFVMVLVKYHMNQAFISRMDNFAQTLSENYSRLLESGYDYLERAKSEDDLDSTEKGMNFLLKVVDSYNKTVRGVKIDVTVSEKEKLRMVKEIYGIPDSTNSLPPGESELVVEEEEENSAVALMRSIVKG